MATPTLVTVTGDLAPNLGASQVVFHIPTLVRYASGPDVILPGNQLTTNVANDGTFTLQVYGTNDPNWSPTNWTYEVRILGDDLHETFDAQVPYDAVAMNFSALLPAQSASLGTLYAGVNHGSHVLVLATGAPVPPGTPQNTLIVRT